MLRFIDRVTAGIGAMRVDGMHQGDIVPCVISSDILPEHADKTEYVLLIFVLIYCSCKNDKRNSFWLVFRFVDVFLLAFCFGILPLCRCKKRTKLMQIFFTVGLFLQFITGS